MCIRDRMRCNKNKINFQLDAIYNPIIDVLNINIHKINESSNLYVLDPFSRMVWSARLEQKFGYYFFYLKQITNKLGAYQIVLHSKNYYGRQEIFVIR